MSVTAKVRCTRSVVSGDQVMFEFGPDYQDGRNAEWAAATPALSLSITVREDVAHHFAEGQSYTLTFTKEDTTDAATDTATANAAGTTLGADDVAHE
jgi:hypothetical protein